jgi:TLP18.3/Psb32/MOLO-1 phosphatase superfamily protein
MINGLQSPPFSAATGARHFARWLWLPMIFGLWMGSSARAVTPQVKDEAAFFSATAVEKANREIAEIERRFHRDFVIETFRTVPADKVEQVKAMDHRGREAFFQKWGNERFRQEGVNGVYLMITKSPGYVQVEVGQETQKHAFTLQEARELRDLVFAAFKKKEHDRGLEESVAFVQRTMANNLAGRQHQGGAAAGPLERLGVNKNPLEQLGVNKNAPIGGAGMSWIVWAIIIVVGVWIVMALLRGISRGIGGGGGGAPGPGGYGGGYGGGGGGGGFMSGMLGGLFGAAAGNWLYDSFARGGSGGGFGGGGRGLFNEGTSADGSDVGQDASGVGGEFDDSSQSDSGGDSGGDFGGGDFGGGDFGGDSGGGDFGGGDF